MVTPDPPADTLVKSPRFFHEHFDGFTGSEQQGNEVEWNEMIAITHTHKFADRLCRATESGQLRQASVKRCRKLEQASSKDSAVETVKESNTFTSAASCAMAAVYVQKGCLCVGD